MVGIAAASKYYDSTSKASLVTSRATLEGVLPGDDVTLDATAAVGTFDDARLGIGKAVPVRRQVEAILASPNLRICNIINMHSGSIRNVEQTAKEERRIQE